MASPQRIIKNYYRTLVFSHNPGQLHYRTLVFSPSVGQLITLNSGYIKNIFVVCVLSKIMVNLD